MDASRITLRIIGMPQGCYGCITFLVEDLWILLHDHLQRGRKTPGHPRIKYGCIRTSQGQLGCVYGPHGWGLQIFITPVSMGGVDQWISGCLDANGYKRGLGPAHLPDIM